MSAIFTWVGNSGIDVDGLRGLGVLVTGLFANLCLPLLGLRHLYCYAGGAFLRGMAALWGGVSQRPRRTRCRCSPQPPALPDRLGVVGVIRIAHEIRVFADIALAPI